MTNLSASREADWGSLQLLRKVYGALAQEFSIDLAPCNELENPEEDGSPEAREAALAWFSKADERIGVHQLRQFLQTSRLADETALRASLAYSLHKSEYSDADRDKIDFLLVQFFSVCAPSLLEDGEVTFGFVAETLKPVLGSSDLTPFGSLAGLDDVIQKASACHTLSALFKSGAIEKGRQLKFSAANNYFEAAALVSFTRFNFLLRRCFFRTMHRDLNAILDGFADPGRSRSADTGLPVGGTFGGRAGGTAAHDLPILESDVPRGVFLWTATADAYRFALRGGCSSERQQRRNCK